MLFNKYITRQSNIFIEKVFNTFDRKALLINSILELTGEEIKHTFKYIHHDINNNMTYNILVLNKNIIINKDFHTNVTTKCDFIIGRKYKCKNKMYPSAFDILVKGIYKVKNINKISKLQKYKKEEFSKNNTSSISTDIYKHLKREAIERISIELRNINMENSICLDLEYINDIYDTYDDFPLSQNHSHIFMIGCQYMKNNIFNIYTKDTFSKSNEYNIIQEFLNSINKNTCIIHWSHADKTYLLKSLERYPDLMSQYNKLNIVYIDLMKIFKECKYPTYSYSLKVIVKDILDYNYTSTCLNGLDAITACIYNYTDNLQDLIEYNKQDTILLKKLIKHCL